MLFNIAIESLAKLLQKSNLMGFNINNDMERLIAILFADNTTVFLRESDSFGDLQEILKIWCRASRASFNVPKIVVVLVGKTEYRENLINTRCFNQTNPPISDIYIVREEKATRLLRAFIGNEINEASIWAPIVEAVAKDLKRWAKGHPTIEGKRLVIEMIVEGHTQYKTCVQGMPQQVEAILNKIIKDFMWGNSHSTIELETLQLLYERGGQKLLNLKVRNEAIEIIKTQHYPRFGEQCPEK